MESEESLVMKKWFGLYSRSAVKCAMLAMNDPVVDNEFTPKGVEGDLGHRLSVPRDGASCSSQK